MMNSSGSIACCTGAVGFPAAACDGLEGWLFDALAVDFILSFDLLSLSIMKNDVSLS
jgi:hypothetical protein